MEATSRAVIDYIEGHRHELIALLQEMVRTRSVNPAFDPASPGEGAMAELVRERYESIDIPVRVLEGSPSRPNVIATWDGTEGSKSLLVNCHLDTHAADVGEWIDPFTGDTVREWTLDPFGGEICEDHVYGRGAVDHKSPIAATLLALEALRANDVSLKGTVTCIHDADEETGGRWGMQYLLDTVPFEYDMALYACTSEFTPLGRDFFSAMGTSNVIRSFSGWQTYRIGVEGRNLHSLSPKRGYGATEAALCLIEALRPLLDEVNRYVDPLEGTGQPPMRVSAIDSEARSAHHHQSRRCEVVVNRRIPPSVDPQSALSQIEARVEEYNGTFPDNKATLTVLTDEPPRETPPDHPLVGGLAKAITQATGEQPAIAGVPSAVGISTVLSKRKIPTVLFGYGILNLHHAIDERIHCEALVKTAKVYALALMEWLGVEDDGQ